MPLASLRGVGRAEVKQRVLSQQYEAFSFQDRGFTDFWFDAGVGTGKTHIASRWVHRQIVEQPPFAIGFIGANDFDQLNMAVLPPLLSYLEDLGIEWVIHKKPPASWTTHSPFPVHNNILSLSTGHQIICKPMKAKNFNIPGVQIAWWWVDEIGDVPHEAMQKIRERRRQPKCYWLGLVTGTPNGPDHFTFKDFMNPGTRLPRHGFTVASTLEGVEAGWLERSYYDGLKAQYSKRKGLVRLDGQVIDTDQLRAYESHDTDVNCTAANPFNGGQPGPSDDYPMGVFCDFNPVKRCIWELGNFDHNRTHVFDEVALETTRVEVMFREVIRRYGRWPAGFHFFGDASGTRAEMTSGNACFETIKNLCNEMKVRAQFTTPRANPHVVDRIEAVNASLNAYDGTVKLTYDEKHCPHLHLDFLRVGWDGVKLEDNNDPDRTHASDAVGYHVAAVRPVRGPSYVPIGGHGAGIIHE